MAEPPTWVALRSTELSAEIDPLGAQLSRLRDRDGRDLLWHGDPALWAGRAPLLFPIVGSLANGGYLLGDRRYALPRHGLARVRKFDAVATNDSAVTFRLCADTATLAVYPFRFELDVSFELTGATLAVTATVRNTGDVELPASLGFHPGFAWPLPYGAERAAHFIEFTDDEPAPIRRLDSAGLLTPAAQPTPVVGKRLALDDELFRADVLILDEPRSHSLRYGADGAPKLEIRYPDARYLGLWTKPGAPFICIEPWQGVTDPVGYAGDLFAKPGIFVVPPGAEHSLRMTVALLAA